MAQQVQLLGTLVHNPDLVVFDEPFSGLDALNQGKLERMIRSLAERGTTVIFSTHVIAHAERLCDQIAIIAGGKVRFEGTVADARATLPFKAHYVPHHPNDGILALLPADAVSEGDGWRFPLPDEGIEGTLVKLIDAGYGISGLSIERPSLHDVFVRIVGAEALAESEALEAEARS